jgi:hypothetical protein
LQVHDSSANVMHFRPSRRKCLLVRAIVSRLGSAVKAAHECRFRP